MKPEQSSDKFNLAAIDIGSNAARILIKQVERTKSADPSTGSGQLTARPRCAPRNCSSCAPPLRLGIDVFRSSSARLPCKNIGRISEEHEAMLIRTMKVFRHLLILYKVKDYRARASAAIRDAKNGKRKKYAPP